VLLPGFCPHRGTMDAFQKPCSRWITLKVTQGCPKQWNCTYYFLLVTTSILHCFRDITTSTAYVTACDLEKSFIFWYNSWSYRWRALPDLYVNMSPVCTVVQCAVLEANAEVSGRGQKSYPMHWKPLSQFGNCFRYVATCTQEVVSHRSSSWCGMTLDIWRSLLRILFVPITSGNV